MAKKDENKTVDELKAELQKIKMQILTGEEKDTSKVSKLKRDIARKLNNKEQVDTK